MGEEPGVAPSPQVAVADRCRCAPRVMARQWPGADPSSGAGAAPSGCWRGAGPHRFWRLLTDVSQITFASDSFGEALRRFEVTTARCESATLRVGRQRPYLPRRRYSLLGIGRIPVGWRGGREMRLGREMPHKPKLGMNRQDRVPQSGWSNICTTSRSTPRIRCCSAVLGWTEAHRPHVAPPNCARAWWTGGRGVPCDSDTPPHPHQPAAAPRPQRRLPPL